MHMQHRWPYQTIDALTSLQLVSNIKLVSPILQQKFTHGSHSSLYSPRKAVTHVQRWTLDEQIQDREWRVQARKSRERERNEMKQRRKPQEKLDGSWRFFPELREKKSKAGSLCFRLTRRMTDAGHLAFDSRTILTLVLLPISRHLVRPRRFVLLYRLFARLSNFILSPCVNFSGPTWKLSSGRGMGRASRFYRTYVPIVVGCESINSSSSVYIVIWWTIILESTSSIHDVERIDCPVDLENDRPSRSSDVRTSGILGLVW